MALTRTVTHGSNTAAAVATTAVTHTITATSLVVVIIQFATNGTLSVDAGTPMSVSGTAMTWTKLLDSGPSTASTVVATRMYAAISNGSGSRTFTHTKSTSTTMDRRMSVFAFEGALTTVATAIPSGNRFVTTSNAGNVSRSITPAGVGSMIVGGIGDWNQTNSYSVLSGNTNANSVNIAGQYTGIIIEPTTNPLTSASAFTWGANSTGANTYAVCEIVPAASTDPVGRKLIIPQSIQRASNW